MNWATIDISEIHRKRIQHRYYSAKTLKDKKISWKVVNEISSDHNTIKLDLDINTDQQQAKLKRPSYDLGKANWEMLHEELTRTEPSSLQQSERSRDRIHKLDNQNLKAIPKTYINE
jgi:hypothetical protein